MWILVLPEPKDGPTTSLERDSRPSVPGDVGFQLRTPVRRVRLGIGHMLRAPVPKAAVYVDCEAPPREQEVGASPDPVGDHPPVDEEAKSSAVQGTADLTLGRGVPAPVCQHPPPRIRGGGPRSQRSP
jgi:hypothetical protein